MGIDKINKGGPPAAVTGTSSPAAPAEADAPFQVHNKQTEKAHGAHATAAAAGSESPIDQLRAGRIDIQAYLDKKVEEATTHLHSLGPTELNAIRAMLRDQLATDPALAELVKQATGVLPPASNE